MSGRIGDIVIASRNFCKVLFKVGQAARLTYLGLRKSKPDSLSDLQKMEATGKLNSIRQYSVRSTLLVGCTLER